MLCSVVVSAVAILNFQGSGRCQIFCPGGTQRWGWGFGGVVVGVGGVGGDRCRP